MRLLKEGMSGEDVLRWQQFLRGQFPSYSHLIIADGKFGNWTTALTKVFEKMYGLPQDGVVDNGVIAMAAIRGFPVVTSDDTNDKKGPAWPPKPEGVDFLGPVAREKLFGKFDFKPVPTKANSEGIKILGRWARDNVTKVEVSQLKKFKVKNSPKTGQVWMHKEVHPQMVGLWNAWEKEGLMDRVLTWNGSYVPRFIRGSRTTLSNHSWGTAFDINVAWNPLGVQPALVGQKGSVRELVEIAVEYGFVWGGWMNRHDGMHFEAFKVL